LFNPAHGCKTPRKAWRGSAATEDWLDEIATKKPGAAEAATKPRPFLQKPTEETEAAEKREVENAARPPIHSPRIPVDNADGNPTYQRFPDFLVSKFPGFPPRVLFRVFRGVWSDDFRVNSEEYRSFLLELAAASGDFIRPFFASPDLVVETKSDKTPVTLADRRAEELMRRMIGHRYPSHGILGEELGPENTDAEFVWVLDPIDGTRAFAAATPLFGTLIALLITASRFWGPSINRSCSNWSSATAAAPHSTAGPSACAQRRASPRRRYFCSDVLSPAQHQDGEAFAALAGA